MLETLDLTQKLKKSEYSALVPDLRVELRDHQQAVYAAGIQVVILFEGWDAAGKGTPSGLLSTRWTHVGSRCTRRIPPQKKSASGLTCGGSGQGCPPAGSLRCWTAAGIARGWKSVLMARSIGRA